MRERKFKAYIPEENKFVSVHAISNNNPCSPDSGEEKYNWKLLESIGAVDKNGVEIYEHDIVMFKNNYPGNTFTQDPLELNNDFAVVLWSDKFYGWVLDARFKNNKEKSIGLFIDFISEFGESNKTWEIIGKLDDDHEDFLSGYFGDKE